ncbi:MAG: methyl-accepting chemotaxis protein [Chlorobi bacterium]|nr:methyl-accepting chemotaxis protein [Chlorobiota bacterium]
MKNLSITTKLIIFVSILGIVSVFFIAYISINATNRILHDTAVKEIESSEGIKKYQVENYLKKCMNSVEVVKLMPTTARLFSELENNKRSALVERYSHIIAAFGRSNDLKDIFLMDASAKVLLGINSSNISSEAKMDNLGFVTSLWKECSLTDKSLISDMTLDSDEKPVMYVGIRLMDNNKLIGVIISSIKIEPIDRLLTNDISQSETGETYLVGSDNRLRSNSRFSTEQTTLKLKVNTLATKRVFDGYSGTELIEDYRNQEVLSSFDLIDIEGLNWAIITEIDKAEIFSARDSLVHSILIVSIIVLLVMFPSLYFIGRLMVKPLKMEIEYAKKLADGYLDSKLDIYQKDEMGILADMLRQMALKTKEVIITVVNAANNLADASFQLSSASQDISSGASQQASSIEEVSASIEQMTSNIQQNADNARKTEDITKEVNTQVTDGSKIVLSTVEAMENIADKISIISDIAFQTNILALNASVEAARAGEYGKGFGVVASEVGKLADKTKTAASDINSISKSSVEVAEKTKDLMGDIVPAINKSSLLVQEISAASKEQRDAADQINNAIQMLNDISQQNAASSEEMATNSEELSGQAEQLLNVIAHFKIETIDKYASKTRENRHKLLTDNKVVDYGRQDNVGARGVDIKLDDDSKLDDEFEKF